MVWSSTMGIRENISGMGFGIKNQETNEDAKGCRIDA
jgi:hypothetical protein